MSEVKFSYRLAELAVQTGSIYPVGIALSIDFYIMPHGKTSGG